MIVDVERPEYPEDSERPEYPEDLGRHEYLGTSENL